MNERLLALRKSLHRTQSEFGAALGVSRDVIASLESGRVPIKDNFVKLVCNTFRVSELWLRYGSGPMLDDSKPSILARLAEEKQLTPREQAIVSAFIDLPPQDRAAIMRYMDSLVEKLSQAPPDPQKKDPATASSSGT